MTGRLQKSARPKAMFKGTRLCSFYLAGRCTRGTECAFAHGDEHLREKPDFHKTRFCVQFSTKGWCPDQDGCSFAHSAEELRGSRREEELKQAMSNAQNGGGGLKRRGRSSKQVMFEVDDDGASGQKLTTPAQALANFLSNRATSSLDALQRSGLYARVASDYQDDLESLSTDFMSELNTPCFSKTSSLTSSFTVDNFGSRDQVVYDHEAPGDELRQLTPHGWPNTQIGPQPDNLSKIPLVIPEYPGARLVVKNTFLHFERTSTGCAQRRSRSCDF